jgi:hypothetical protein
MGVHLGWVDAIVVVAVDIEGEEQSRHHFG